MPPVKGQRWPAMPSLRWHNKLSWAQNADRSWKFIMAASKKMARVLDAVQGVPNADRMMVALGRYARWCPQMLRIIGVPTHHVYHGFVVNAVALGEYIARYHERVKDDWLVQSVPADQMKDWVHRLHYLDAFCSSWSHVASNRVMHDKECLQRVDVITVRSSLQQVLEYENQKA
jgi:hypothetical protein